MSMDKTTDGINKITLEGR